MGARSDPAQRPTYAAVGRAPVRSATRRQYVQPARRRAYVDVDDEVGVRAPHAPPWQSHATRYASASSGRKRRPNGSSSGRLLARTSTARRRRASIGAARRRLRIAARLPAAEQPVERRPLTSDGAQHVHGSCGMPRGRRRAPACWHRRAASRGGGCRPRSVADDRTGCKDIVADADHDLFAMSAAVALDERINADGVHQTHESRSPCAHAASPGTAAAPAAPRAPRRPPRAARLGEARPAGSAARSGSGRRRSRAG